VPDHPDLKDRFEDLEPVGGDGIKETFVSGNPVVARIKVQDKSTDDDPDVIPDVSDESDNDFHIDYHEVKWVIRDMLTNMNLTGLKGICVSADWGVDTEADDPSHSGYGIVDEPYIGLANPVMRVPWSADKYLATWKKSGYGDKDNIDFLASDHTEYLLMETTVIHLYRGIQVLVHPGEERPEDRSDSL